MESERQTKPENFNRVWIPDAEEVWRSAEITKDLKIGDTVLHLCLEDGTHLKYPVEPEKQVLPPLRNPDILVGENDLTALSYLHEPAVLHNLKVRFVESNVIYTYSGIILVAINPYKELPIYGDAIIHAYSGQNMGDIDPHIFAVAEEAYKQMARNNRNQSIIVSGESGAGKTVSARYTMRYFATVSKTSSKAHVEDKVLASNPITEAIGNAKTTRNDNSSRFGKYTEISFDRRYKIIGANLRTYLLEKSRVVFQSENERNYHIFYQLCASANKPEFEHLHLTRAEEFNYTSMGGCTVITGVDDKKDMLDTQKTFALLGLGTDFQMDVFKVVAAILHLGNVEIKRVSDDRSSVDVNDKHLKIFCDLLNLEASKVAQWLCNRRIVTVSDTVIKPMTKQQADNARDALAKKIYSHLFDYVIDKINNALQYPGKQHTFIGVLDIYGFETFEINSFEQFCINYANEKLQQQFNLHVFKLEQEEYMKEDIPWTLIDFYDNQIVIDLIEAKMGILDLLDEECLLPQGTDENWLQKLYNNYLNKNPLFEKPRMSNRSFIIQHFADKVEYKCDGFLEKNRDTVYDVLIDLLRTSKFQLCSSFFQDNTSKSAQFSSGIQVKSARPAIKSSNKEFRMTVGSKFRNSLCLLMETLNATTPHYVRCIKPNDLKLPFEFDAKRVVQQLRACGVLETIRISAQSYPSRWTYIEFFGRYSILMTQQELSLNDKKYICKIVLQRLIQDSNQYQFGRTKIFFRAGQVAYLEKLRSDKLRNACVIIQKSVRGWVQKKKFSRARRSAIVIQQYFRGQRAVRQAISGKALKHAWAAIIIQKYVRGFLVRRIYQLILVATVTIQSFTRGYLARKRYHKMREEHKALILQKYARAWLARRRFQNVRRFVLNIQLSYRVQRLQKKLEDQNKENHGLLERLTSLASSHTHDVDKVHKLESELEKISSQKKHLDEKGKKYKEEAEEKMTKLQAQNAELLEQKHQMEVKLETKTQEMKDQMDQLTNQLFTDVEKEEKQRMKLEKHFEAQVTEFDTMIEKLKDEIQVLKERNKHLLKQAEEEQLVNDGLREEIDQLSIQVKKIPTFQTDIELLENQKRDLEHQLQEQKREMREKLDEMAKQLLNSFEIEDVKARLAEEELGNLNEDGEIWFAYEGLKKATRILEAHFQTQRENYEKDIELLNFKVEHLHDDIKQIQNSYMEEKDSKESITLEVERLRSDNKVVKDLRKKLAELEEQNMDLQGRLYEQTMKLPEKSNRRKNYPDEDEVSLKLWNGQRENDMANVKIQAIQTDNMYMKEQNEADTRDFEEQVDMKDRTIRKLQDQIKALTKSIEKDDEVRVPTVFKDYLGMLEFASEDESKLIRNLILDLKPRGVVVNMIPGLPAHIMFMCVRYTDYINNAERIKSLMNASINSIKQVIKEHADDFEMLSFWLSNVHHFLNCLKQYSGEEEFMKYNQPLQNKNCLKNFDLSEYRQIISDLAIRIYHQFITVMENNLQPMIVPGMLEYESLHGISVSKPTGFRKRSSSIDDTDSYTMTSILQQLSYFYTTMCQHGMDPELLKQTMKQLFFLIATVTINSLFLRKDMCSCRKGMQIRCNISYLEEWLQGKNLQGATAKETLEPLSQAAWLLQVKKITDDDAKEIYERCTALSSVQIVKILNSYTPIDDFEKRVTPSFVRKVQSMLNNREDCSQLMLDSKYLFQVTFPFSPSPHALEMIQIPSSLKLGFLTRI
ncbi:unconventional myosin-Vc isoform X2 [Xenopus tropicalis]|uniref:Unconventional myosin-Vc isoform X2 n=1 Tax=Xenopus tropicalis TaxID=8364 RepID=A0A8J1JB10_XENTR|nr:unconventional myosin-Vc isoform X2 [Xenopus tropicalis]